MALTLEQYCEKYDYEIVERYTTIGGENGGNYRRAIVRNNKTNERYHLYFDRSGKWIHDKNASTDVFGHLCTINCGFRQRGWRNTTLENRRSRQARRDKNVSRPSR